jgi:predicted Zn-dependent protease
MDRIAMVALFSPFHEWRERRQVLRDLERQDVAETVVLTRAIEDELSVAVSAVRRGDHLVALQFWNDLVNRHPQQTQKSPRALEILLGLGRLDEAEGLMRLGDKEHPGDARFLTGLVGIANERRDWDNLLRLSAALRKRFPNVLEGYQLPAEALRSLSRLDEAEAITRQAVRRVGDDVRSLLIHAEIAFDRGRWNEALKRFRIAVERFNHSLGFIGMARALHRLGRDVEAEAILLQQAERDSSNRDLPIELARMAQARGDTDLAVERWSFVGERHRSHFAASSLAAVALEQLGAIDEAERLLRSMLDIFENESWINSTLAALLSGQQRHAEAAAVWATVRQKFQDMEAGYIRGAEALEAVGVPDEAAALRHEWGNRQPAQLV